MNSINRLLFKPVECSRAKASKLELIGPLSMEILFPAYAKSVFSVSSIAGHIGYTSLPLISSRVCLPNWSHQVEEKIASRGAYTSSFN